MGTVRRFGDDSNHGNMRLSFSFLRKQRPFLVYCRMSYYCYADFSAESGGTLAYVERDYGGPL